MCARSCLILLLLLLLLLYVCVDIQFVASFKFWLLVALVTGVAVVPIYIAKLVRRYFNPPAWAKVQ
jgi:hypothetical protein